MGVRSINAGGYAVHIGAGLRHEFAARIAASAPAHTYAVITDDNVGPHYAAPLIDALGAHGTVSSHLVTAGEENKTRTSWARLTDELLDAGCARDTTVVALGGGVVGDLAGFVAATFMRGVPVVQCPTSLLAMIDASLGGKTGVDTHAGKNLVGAFHAPAAVLADVEVLATLPLEQRRSGLAEAIKHGIIADAAYLASIDERIDALVAGDAGATLDVVARSVEIKVTVVNADVRERGQRKTLNFGHTLGHAIEQATGYALLHGECVAIGMVLEAMLAERIGVAASGTVREITRILERAGLPTKYPATLSAADVLKATRHDKKTRAGTVEYALPMRVGAMAENNGAWSVAVGDADVRAVLV
ncbi:MAG: 3-dehydroquinate synthase [Gemmatimonadetes bacterium]|nr:3-dehydroquinate synthase [Gemmatimonadota bacterium]